MSRLGKIARRTFLFGSVAIAGGVAFGVYKYRTPGENPLLDQVVEGGAALTPYVMIDPSGVTLITPRADKGQGAYHIQAAMIAEELDIELDQVSVDPGTPSATYYNGALAPEAAEFMVPAAGAVRDIATTGLDAVMKFIGLQITGGSTTVPDGFVKLRQAGAVARETLKAAAAQEFDVAVAELNTAKGAVILPDGRAIPYTDLAARAATIELSGEIALRPSSAWRLLGQPMQRIDMVAKSTGTQDYGIDLRLDEMVHATVKTNPAQGGSLIGFDATDALGMQGVSDVVEITGGVGVIADTTWTAIQAAEAIAFEWGPAQMPRDMEGHWAAVGRAFDTKPDSVQRDDGDVDAAIGATPVEAEYRAPYLAHAPLEPINAIVQVSDSGVDVWTGTQVPRFVQSNVAKITGVDAAQVRVHVQMMGGSFGHRLETLVVEQAAEIAMKKKGVPVKLTYSREEDMIHDFGRQIAMARVRGAVKDGRVEAMDLGIAMPSVVVSQMGRQGLSAPGPDSQIVAGAWEQSMAVPNLRVSGYRAEPLAPISSWRSVGASTNGFFFNAALDELIHAAGADPMEERLRLCNSDVGRAVLDAVKQMSGWTGADLGAGRGRGVAMTRSFGVECAQVIEVTDTSDGIKIDKVFVAADVGKILDPENFVRHIEGGVIWALGHAMTAELTYTDGIADQWNYDSFQAMRSYQAPEIIVQGLENASDIRGIGEPPVPPAAAALAGAIFAATGTRLREMPFSKTVDFA